MRVKKYKSKMKLSKIIILSALCMLAASCSPDIEKGLVLHSDFEGDARDESPNNYNGALRGRAEISEDSAVGESSVYFDGNRAYVEYPSEKVYFNTDYSVSIWVKWEEERQFSRIFDFNQVLPGYGNSLSLYAGRPDKKGRNNLWLEQWAYVEDGTVKNIIDVNKEPAEAALEYDFQTGKWDHYVIVYKASALNLLGSKKDSKGLKVPFKGKLTLYVNGKKVDHTAHCLKPQNVPTVDNWLGRSRYTSDPLFKGWMDDFRIYDRCLTAKEIEELYNLGSE